jgi:hypothetical protein
MDCLSRHPVQLELADVLQAAIEVVQGTGAGFYPTQRNLFEEGKGGLRAWFSVCRLFRTADRVLATIVQINFEVPPVDVRDKYVLVGIVKLACSDVCEKLSCVDILWVTRVIRVL